MYIATYWFLQLNYEWTRDFASYWTTETRFLPTIYTRNVILCSSCEWYNGYLGNYSYTDYITAVLLYLPWLPCKLPGTRLIAVVSTLSLCTNIEIHVCIYVQSQTALLIFLIELSGNAAAFELTGIRSAHDLCYAEYVCVVWVHDLLKETGKCISSKTLHSYL